MPRAATSSDVYNAVAEPHRRVILDFLAPAEHSAGEVVAAVGLSQPSVSKHLRALREQDLVRPRRDGRRMFYRTNAQAIKPKDQWAGAYEGYWQQQPRRINRC